MCVWLRVCVFVCICVCVRVCFCVCVCVCLYVFVFVTERDKVGQCIDRSGQTTEESMERTLVTVRYTVHAGVTDSRNFPFFYRFYRKK